MIEIIEILNNIACDQDVLTHRPSKLFNVDTKVSSQLNLLLRSSLFFYFKVRETSQRYIISGYHVVIILVNNK